ncbi:unnamed protein product [Ambrosiozyma monospora]|uniref:Unnamed protein product n=1 Tax=Ambrosiozyma monospora TaxID=43982 RepID=A0ACB5STU9_AMBMO|nr:unnamed protein product [Ambrosiozyma monospora]
MHQIKCIKRTKISSTKARQPITDSNIVYDTFSWLTNKNDIKYYTVIKSLPTEIQFQIFSILFQTAHNVNEIIDLIDSSWSAPPDYFKLIISISVNGSLRIKLTSRYGKLATEFCLRFNLCISLGEKEFLPKVAKVISGFSSSETVESIKSLLFDMYCDADQL